MNFLRGTVLITIGNVVLMATGYLTNTFLGRFLGPELYGQYSLVITLMTLLGVAQVTGIPQSLIKYISGNKDRRQVEKIYGQSLKLQTGLSLITTLVYWLAVKLVLEPGFEDQDSRIVLYGAGLNFFLTGIMSMWLAFYNGVQNYRRQAFVSISYYAAKLVLIVALTSRYGLNGAVAGYVLATVIPVLVGARMPRPSQSEFPYRLLVKYGVPVLLFAIVTTLHMSLDLYLVGWMTGSDVKVGLYAASQNVARLVNYTLSAFSVVLFPIFSDQSLLNSKEEMGAIIRQAGRIILLIIVPLTLIISATSRPLLRLLYSSSYEAAAGALAVLVFGMTFTTIATVVTSIINGMGKPVVSLMLAGSGIITTAAVGWWLIPRLDITGAAWATTVGALTTLGLGVVTVNRYYRVMPPVASLVRIGTASMVIYAMSGKLIVGGYPDLVYYPLLGMVYLLVLVALKEITKNDWQQIKEIVPRKNKK